MFRFGRELTAIRFARGAASHSRSQRLAALTTAIGPGRIVKVYSTGILATNRKSRVASFYAPSAPGQRARSPTMFCGILLFRRLPHGCWLVRKVSSSINHIAALLRTVAL
jgi:hypothetical protein